MHQKKRWLHYKKGGGSGKDRSANSVAAASWVSKNEEYPVFSWVASALWGMVGFGDCAWALMQAN